MTQTICIIEGCGGKSTRRGYCGGHVQRIAKYGDPRAHIPIQRKLPAGAPRPVCRVEGCDRIFTTKSGHGLCVTHLKRLQEGQDLAPQIASPGQSVVARLERLSDRTGACWLWLGATIKDGYGTIGIDKRTFLAHRVSYETHVGPIPPELEIDHLCNVRACINPEHLEPVTHQVNVQRGWERRRAIA